MMLASTSSMTALEQAVATTGTMGQWLGSSATHDNKQVLAYTSGLGNQIFAATQSSTGWSTELVRTQADLIQAIEVNVDSLNTPHLVYRHTANNQLEMAVGGSSWTLTALGAPGDALSSQHPTLVLDNDSLATGLVASNQPQPRTWRCGYTTGQPSPSTPSPTTVNSQANWAWPSSTTVRCWWLP